MTHESKVYQNPQEYGLTGDGIKILWAWDDAVEFHRDNGGDFMEHFRNYIRTRFDRYGVNVGCDNGGTALMLQDPAFFYGEI